MWSSKLSGFFPSLKRGRSSPDPLHGGPSESVVGEDVWLFRSQGWDETMQQANFRSDEVACRTWRIRSFGWWASFWKGFPWRGQACCSPPVLPAGSFGDPPCGQVDPGALAGRAGWDHYTGGEHDQLAAAIRRHAGGGDSGDGPSGEASAGPVEEALLNRSKNRASRDNSPASGENASEPSGARHTYGRGGWTRRSGLGAIRPLLPNRISRRRLPLPNDTVGQEGPVEKAAGGG